MDNPDMVAAIVAALLAAAGWLKSHSEVKNVKNDRETTRQQRDTEIALLKSELETQKKQAEDTEVVVDFQSAESVPLKILNKDDNFVSDDGFVLQAPNTVRRYVYKGSTTGWVVLY